MTNAIANAPPTSATIERVLIQGDLSALTEADRVAYYGRVCETLGLNPATRPFEYLKLNGKLILYARKDATEQLRKLNGVSVVRLTREVVEGIYVVTARVKDGTGRTDESIGAVPIDGLKGEARANAMMKAETKSKRRATLSICGLGMLDETEVETSPGATPQPADRKPQKLAPVPDDHDTPMQPPPPAPAERPGDVDADGYATAQGVLSAIQSLGPSYGWSHAGTRTSVAKVLGRELRPDERAGDLTREERTKVRTAFINATEAKALKAQQGAAA